eukprot:TRINITY_DN731_c0_g1_i1.p1 TRINITY_DN731_c0_g1~~TRINITY_DN731_c0_g1_i1.p1  ORF type:complete len:828 (-),score=267.80 TRINITY_DN731_c0_g1_i1:48-2531(-)
MEDSITQRFEEIKQQLEDPITFEHLKNPVVTPCGHTFDQSSIEQIMNQNGTATCPTCRTEFTKVQVYDDYSKRDLTTQLLDLGDRWKRKKEDEKKEAEEKKKKKEEKRERKYKEEAEKLERKRIKQLEKQEAEQKRKEAEEVERKMREEAESRAREAENKLKQQHELEQQRRAKKEAKLKAQEEQKAQEERKKQLELERSIREQEQIKAQKQQELLKAQRQQELEKAKQRQLEMERSVKEQEEKRANEMSLRKSKKNENAANQQIKKEIEQWIAKLDEAQKEWQRKSSSKTSSKSRSTSPSAEPSTSSSIGSTWWSATASWYGGSTAKQSYDAPSYYTFKTRRGCYRDTPVFKGIKDQDHIVCLRLLNAKKRYKYGYIPEEESWRKPKDEASQASQSMNDDVVEDNSNVSSVLREPMIMYYLHNCGNPTKQVHHPHILPIKKIISTTFRAPPRGSSNIRVKFPRDEEQISTAGSLIYGALAPGGDKHYYMVMDWIDYDLDAYMMTLPNTSKRSDDKGKGKQVEKTREEKWMEEKEAMFIKRVMWQILISLCYLHSANVVHLDLQPSSILIEHILPSRDDKKKKTETWRAYLCSFSSSRFIPDHTTPSNYHAPPSSSSTGSSSNGSATSSGNKVLAPKLIDCEYYGWRAPEVILTPSEEQAKFDASMWKATDMWSLGCLFAWLLTGGQPLFGNSMGPDAVKDSMLELQEILQNTDSKLSTLNTNATGNEGRERLEDRLIRLRESRRGSKTVGDWDLGVDLLKRMLVSDGKGRITAKEALVHPWFKDWRSKLVESSVDVWNYPEEEKVMLMDGNAVNFAKMMASGCGFV